MRRVYLPRLADAAASSMVTYALPLLVLATTGSASLTGLAFVLAWLPRLGTFLLAGTAVDRLGATRVFRAATAARALLAGAAALLLAETDGRADTVVVLLLAPLAGALT
ncbi:hypothetical protein [Streptomyces minutiscleroticus]|uniref:hypothetical protein n=1 Tax=Streptomyces minutiscleroticus TaxID=68238 RepID=UPI003325C906